MNVIIVNMMMILLLLLNIIITIILIFVMMIMSHGNDGKDDDDVDDDQPPTPTTTYVTNGQNDRRLGKRHEATLQQTPDRLQLSPFHRRLEEGGVAVVSLGPLFCEEVLHFRFPAGFNGGQEVVEGRVTGAWSLFASSVRHWGGTCIGGRRSVGEWRIYDVMMVIIPTKQNETKHKRQTDRQTLSDQSINRDLVCACMHSTARTQRILTFMP